MAVTRGRFDGPRLVGWASLALAAMTLAVLAAAGTGVDGVRMLIRATARSSLVLFSLAFTASSLRQLARTPATAWLLRNRRYLGLSFAVSHALHLVGIVALAVRWPEEMARTSATTVIGGGIGYVFVAAMAATSNDRAVAALGRERWRLLHLAGSWLLWGIFASSYLPRAVRSPAYLPLALLALAAVGVRAAAWLQGSAMRRRSPTSSSVGQ
ncbi:MAG TPA: ferric reductase-like transmembrane domain-containing protein [Myxococcota bacterium]|nr:ferric reductase-like transmembrane domain-containing protein [Myxococcota bacterium]